MRPVLALLLLPRVPKPLLHLASALSPPTPAGYTALENPAQCAGAVDLFLSDGERELHKKTSDFNVNIGAGEGGEVMSSSLDVKEQKQSDEGIHEKGTTTAGPTYAWGRGPENERAASQGDRCLDKGGPRADRFQQETKDVGPVGSPPSESSLPSEMKEGSAEDTRPLQGGEGPRTSSPSEDKSSSSSLSPSRPSARTTAGGGPLPSQDPGSCQVSSSMPMSRVTSNSGEEKYLITRERSFSQGYSSPEQSPHHARGGGGDGGLSRYSSFREEARRRGQTSRNGSTKTYPSMAGGVSQTSSSPRLTGGGGRTKSAAAVIAARRPILSVAQKAVERAFEELLDFPIPSEEPDAAVVDTPLAARLSRTQSERMGGREVEGADGDVLSIGHPHHRGGMFTSGRGEDSRAGEKRIPSHESTSCSSDVRGKESRLIKPGESKGEKEEARECWSRRNSGGVSSTVWASPRQMHRDDEDEEEEEEEERGKDSSSKDAGESQGLEKFKSSREDDEEGENEESRGLTQKEAETTGGMVEDVAWVLNPYRRALERFISPVTATARRSDTPMLVGGVLLHAAITHPLVSKVSSYGRVCSFFSMACVAYGVEGHPRYLLKRVGTLHPSSLFPRGNWD